MSELLSVVRVPALRPAEAKVAAPWHDDPSGALLRHFRHVSETRMAGLPFLNPNVEVCVAGCERLQGDWLAAVVTSWSIQLVLLPGGGALWRDTAAGVRRTLGLPVGELVFIGEESDDADAALPAFLYCPLVSPIDDVVGTEVACAIATDALATVLAPAPHTQAPSVPAAVADAPTPPVDAPRSTSRRAFLRGRT
ncbi:[NiFe]-hydrogenase assembly chaperone HybE [Azoarcus sp. KH32C]|uniref:[NiFe]-hydrogenase assembly chaperone HybE n=1 Tax=Azoarcus sp. KH32C TaxID=748247 RepID=UPI0002386F2A|nr:[NiFe]-hydrogenase assembly chaperone HybE [Azoarcus sp. KH32C]BAL26081.1 putative hydrogenase expression/formation protein [Azoarcus sp. KH32C]